MLASALNIPAPDAERAYQPGLSSFSDDGIISDDGLLLFVDSARRMGAPGTASPAGAAHPRRLLALQASVSY